MKNLPRSPVRYQVSMLVRFRIIKTNEWLEANLVNLSTGGLCLESKHLCEKDTDLEIIADSIDKYAKLRRRILRAKVMWRRGQKMGLRFRTKRR